MSESLPLAQPLPELEISIREGGERHWPFVLKTWIMSYAQSEFARPIRPGVFHRFHHELAERVLRRAALRIATPSDDENLFLGWAAHEGDSLLHYVYVKPQFRGLGVCRRLLANLTPDGMRYTHMTAEGKRLARAVNGSTYNPYLVG